MAARHRQRLIILIPSNGTAHENHTGAAVCDPRILKELDRRFFSPSFLQYLVLAGLPQICFLGSVFSYPGCPSWFGWGPPSGLGCLRNRGVESARAAGGPPGGLLEGAPELPEKTRSPAKSQAFHASILAPLWFCRPRANPPCLYKYPLFPAGPAGPPAILPGLAAAAV